MTRVAVTGGSGKLGRAVVTDLAAHGYDVREPRPGGAAAGRAGRLRLASTSPTTARSSSALTAVDERYRAWTRSCTSRPSRRPGSPRTRRPSPTTSARPTTSSRRRAPPASRTWSGRRARRCSGCRSTPRRRTSRSTRTTAAAPGVDVLAGEDARGGDGPAVLPMGPAAEDDRAAVLQRHGPRRTTRPSRSSSGSACCASGISGATSTAVTGRKPYASRWSTRARPDVFIIANADTVMTPPSRDLLERGLPRCRGPRRRRWARRRCCRSTRPAVSSATSRSTPGGTELPRRHGLKPLQHNRTWQADGMDYVRLGRTGLEVSRICPGLHDVRRPGARQPPWTLDEDASRPFIRRRVEARHQLLRHRERLLRRVERGDRRPGAARLRRPRRDRPRHQGARPDAPGPQRRRPVPQGDHDRDRRQPDAGSAPTTSTSTRSTAGTRRRRSRRRWRRCTTWSRPARRATSARPRCTRGSSPRRCYLADLHGWTRFV